MDKRLDTYTDGCVFGVLEGIKAPAAPLLQQRIAENVRIVGRIWGPDIVALQVTNNSQVWSYAIRPGHVVPESATPQSRRITMKYLTDYIPPHMPYKRVESRKALLSGYREPHLWALSDMAKRAKLPAADPNALQFNVAYERPAPAETGKKLQGPRGPIQYTGYEHLPESFPIERLHAILSKAVTACEAVWTWQSAGYPPWQPSRLEVMHHAGNRAMGLAYAPGSGKDPARKRVISLNARLFQFYDDHAIWRVVVHELCHHYRDEVFTSRDVDPDTANRLRQAIVAYRSAGKRLDDRVLGTHDSVFIRELGRVDAKVPEDPVGGLVFTEYADPSLIAEITGRKTARAAKQAAAVSRVPTDGRVYINRRKDGYFTVYWMPLQKGRWKPPSMTLSLTTYRDFITKLGGPEASAQVPVTYSETWPVHYTRPQNLGEFTIWFRKVFGYSF